ncbi:hypothetical protein FJY84_07615 [Candidatus Bathyarchaeota archaeon]|nr:hypothetical protein [Candidatus Bathyarchaeota archaeon]
MSQEKPQEEDFELWLKTRFIEQVWINGHKFRITKKGDIEIDGRIYTVEEARYLYRLIISKNPLEVLNGKFLILERNGTLIRILQVIAVIALIIVFVIVRR